MSACVACSAASPVWPLRSPCGHVLCGAQTCRACLRPLLTCVRRSGRCGALRVCSTLVCPACGASLRLLEAAWRPGGPAAASGELPAGSELRCVRFGHSEVTLRVRVGAGETTHDVVAATFDIPRARLKLLAGGRVVGDESEARAAHVILAVGTPAAAQLPRVPAWRVALHWLAARAATAAGLFPPAVQAARGGWLLLGRVAAVAAQFTLSLLSPTHAPPPQMPPE